jgi:hypothetical protein
MPTILLFTPRAKDFFVVCSRADSPVTSTYPLGMKDNKREFKTKKNSSVYIHRKKENRFSTPKVSQDECRMCRRCNTNREARICNVTMIID